MRGCCAPVIGALLALVGATTTVAAQTSSPTCLDVSVCRQPTKAQIMYLCTNISERSKDLDDDSPFVYLYERTLWEMVGARPGTDSLASVAPRVRLLWSRYHDDFACDTSGLANGGLLAYAIHNDFIDPIHDLITNYHIDPNVYDRSVKGTVLDFVDSELARLQRNADHRTPQIREYESMRQLLIEWGVKHWRDGRTTRNP